MGFTRRDFMKGCLLLGGPALLLPRDLHGRQRREETWQPAYAKLEKEGKLARKIEQAYGIFENCQLCPRRCGVNRRKGQKGFCRAPL
ncbi:MAG: radical SAM protein, partial [Proteobacteria bacterium]|nr:radical SAM protein [Pseudomonadota bacterium]